MKKYFYMLVIAIALFTLTGCPKPANLLPTVTGVTGPAGYIHQDNGTFTWSGNDPDGSIARYEYKKDNGEWTSNGTGTSYTWDGFSEGEHNFYVRAVDDEGAYSQVISWNFDYSL